MSSASDFPAEGEFASVAEPMVMATIVVPAEYEVRGKHVSKADHFARFVGAVITLCVDHRATPVSNEPLGEKVEEFSPM